MRKPSAGADRGAQNLGLAAAGPGDGDDLVLPDSLFGAACREQRDSAVVGPKELAARIRRCGRGDENGRSRREGQDARPGLNRRLSGELSRARRERIKAKLSRIRGHINLLS
jgi:hypothetical protein